MASKTAPQHPNRFKEYHEYLMNNDSIEWKSTVENICEQLGISERSYYRKLENPASLSIAEKEAIGRVYQLPVHFIFPELEPVAA